MLKLLARPAVTTLRIPNPNPTQIHDRRYSVDRRSLPSSLREVWRWYSALAIKLGSVLLLAALVAWHQKNPAPSGMVRRSHGGQAIYQWDGFHRVKG